MGTSLYTEDEDQTNKGLEGVVIGDIVRARLYDMDRAEELEEVEKNKEGEKPEPNYTKDTVEIKEEDWGDDLKHRKIDVMYLDRCWRGCRT